MNYLDLYTSLVSANSVLPKSEEEINSWILYLKSAINNEVDDDAEYRTAYYKGVSLAIYNIIDVVQDRVADLDKISSHQGDSSGITKASKARVFLLGETSAGKTTFLQRMFGEPCGKTGATPITAFTVIHKITEANSYLEVSFKEHFTVVDVEMKVKFEDFLKKYNFFDDFSINDLEFSTQGEFAMRDKDEFINFLYEANKYPVAFDEITWHHKKLSKQIDFLEYADIYDMPGSGGLSEHDDNLKSALRRYGNRIDIVLYLIKPDQGIPSSYGVMKNLRETLLSVSASPQLYYVYQIRNGSEFCDLKQNLRVYVEKDKSSDAIEPFEAEEREYFLDAGVLDARGDRNDRVGADAALAAVLQHFYIKKVEIFLKSVFVSSVPREYDVINAGNSTTEGINSLLINFLDKWAVKRGEDGKLPSISQMKEDFKRVFKLMDNCDYSIFCKDLGKTLQEMKCTILHDIDEMFDYLKKNEDGYISEKFNLKMSPKSLGRVLSIQKNDDGYAEEKFDKTKYEEDFVEHYNTKDNWQRLIYNIQAFHWLRLNYSGNTINDIYAKVSAEPVKAYLKEYLERLKRIQNELPLLAELREV